MNRIITTMLQGDLNTERVPMKDLKVGDRIVQEGVYSEDFGVHTAIYEVTGDCASHERGWLFVRNIEIDPTERWGDGTLKCEGFFDYPTGTLMHKVI